MLQYTRIRVFDVTVIWNILAKSCFNSKHTTIYAANVGVSLRERSYSETDTRNKKYCIRKMREVSVYKLPKQFIKLWISKIQNWIFLSVWWKRYFTYLQRYSSLQHDSFSLLCFHKWLKVHYVSNLYTKHSQTKQWHSNVSEDQWRN